LQEISQKHRLFIDGIWVEGEGDSFGVVSPVTGQTLGVMPLATENEVRAAIDAAETAKERWRMTPKFERAKILVNAAEELRQISGSAAKEITLEMGKPIMAAKLELEYSQELIINAAEEIKHAETASIPCRNPKMRAFTVLEPYGVFAIIAPWNFPYQTPLSTLSYALAAGNTVVFKPAEQTPISGERIVQCFERAGVPKGVINLVQGNGEITGEAITSSHKLDGVGFTGSIEVGKRIASKQGGRLTHFIFELGGNGPIIVLDDAEIPQTAQIVTESCYGNAGQDCQAGERILVQEGVYDKLLQEIIKNTQEWALGDPLVEGTRMGPLVDESVASKVDAHIADAVRLGAKARTGGGRAKGYPTNLYYESTVLDGVTTDMAIAKEETFGPVCPVMKFGDAEEAVEIANSGEYGLSSSVFTRDAKKAMILSERIQTGEVVLNYASTYGDINVPFGGMRKSGIGRVHGKYGLASFSQLKSIFWYVG
jgi:succinate-semialdehyde dehydrogenase/glutarate-semialdehyde dehydrogenase